MAALELERIVATDVTALLERECEARTYGVVEVHIQAGQIVRVHAHRTEIIRVKSEAAPDPGRGRT